MDCDALANGQEWEDPIVKEIHEIRERLAARFGYDMSAFMNYIREREAEARKRGVVFSDQLEQPQRSARESQTPDAA